MKIEFTSEALGFFNELSTILYKKEYFGLQENALKYVDELLEDIRITLPARVKKPAPAYFDKYGKKMLYSTFRKNKATQWHVFFNVYQKDDEMIFIIRYISNNHVIAKYL
jgi:hypothetical protein